MFKLNVVYLNGCFPTIDFLDVDADLVHDGADVAGGDDNANHFVLVLASYLVTISYK
jgi:hypothetical protein